MTLISNNAAAAHLITLVSYASTFLTPSQFQQSTSKNGTSDYVDMFWNNVRAFIFYHAALTNSKTNVLQLN